MDDNAKKKLALAKKLIQENKYQEALEDLEIMVYKYSKLFQVHLMTALCYTKIGKDNEAEREYLEVLDLKSD
jgi:Tfp pilus assembly protein PilF